MDPLWRNFILATLALFVGLIGDCACTSPGAGAGPGATAGPIGPGASIHTLTLANGSSVALVAIVAGVLVAAGYALYKANPKEPRA